MKSWTGWSKSRDGMLNGRRFHMKTLGVGETANVWGWNDAGIGILWEQVNTDRQTAAVVFGHRGCVQKKTKKKKSHNPTPDGEGRGTREMKANNYKPVIPQQQSWSTLYHHHQTSPNTQSKSAHQRADAGADTPPGVVTGRNNHTASDHIPAGHTPADYNLAHTYSGCRIHPAAVDHT